jgi:hypothetical protein
MVFSISPFRLLFWSIPHFETTVMDVFLVIFLQKVHYLVPRLGMFPKQWKDSIFIWGIQAVYLIPTPY